ncbi:MAG: hypothetical protein KGH71_06045 [Candidatus Micrarchaeota archaeon]|nr:hypothetical protein [Candidatus Micrarchaeota archaeon]
MKKGIMKKPKFTIAQIDPALTALVEKTDKRTLALWAIDCTRRVLPYFKREFPNDARPQTALKVLQKWRRTGVFRMSEIRKASLDSHAAAREAREDSPARSAARAAGQAVATVHVMTHSLGASIYALQAIYRASKPSNVEKAIERERAWQHARLIKLRERAAGSKL